MTGSQFCFLNIAAVGFIDNNSIRHFHDTSLNPLQFITSTGQLDQQKEIWDMIYEYFAFVKANGYFEYRRNEQAKYWMYESINEHLRDSFYNNEKIISMLAAKEEEVLNGKLTSFVAAKKLLDAYFSTLK